MGTSNKKGRENKGIFTKIIENQEFREDVMLTYVPVILFIIGLGIGVLITHIVHICSING